MRFLFRVFLFAGGAIFSAFTHVHAQGKSTEATLGQAFPQQISFSYEGKDYLLKKTGASELKHVRGDRSRSILTLTHYMQNPPAGTGVSAIESILKSSAAKQLIMQIKKDFDVGKFSARLDMFFNQAISQAELQKVQQNYKVLLAYFSDAVNEDDEFVVRWLPDGKLIISTSGRQDKVINDSALALVFWKVWLGELSPVNRTELVSLLTSR